MRTKSDEVRLRRFEQPRGALVVGGTREQQGSAMNLDQMREKIIVWLSTNPVAT